MTLAQQRDQHDRCPQGKRSGLAGWLPCGAVKQAIALSKSFLSPFINQGGKKRTYKKERLSNEGICIEDNSRSGYVRRVDCADGLPFLSVVVCQVEA
ncbi:MAG: hypothetical protein K8S55_02325 [Phycisphaerae bacterium]|nr:hypothetical protein [Phycisphaerae bacterium]